MKNVRRSADLRAASARKIAATSASYPQALRLLPQPPDPIWVMGQLPQVGQRCIAIVGARAASGAGCGRARAIAAGLGCQGAAIISGGALGIDAAAHEGALQVGAASFAVLGCGIDVVYPDRHADLFARISDSGGLLSEYEPGEPPRVGQFPVRNRIIAALSEAVLVVEAAFRSGALITATLAQELGKKLLAVPGSPGTDRLCCSGRAMPVTSVADIEKVLAGGVAEVALPELPAGPVRTLLEALRAGHNTPARLCLATGLQLRSVLAGLAEAELEGWVHRGVGNEYEVLHRGC